MIHFYDAFKEQVLKEPDLLNKPADHMFLIKLQECAPAEPSFTLDVQTVPIRRAIVTDINLKDFHPSDLVIDEYERAHPGDTWAALERRAGFNRQDRKLMQDWLALAAKRERAAKIELAQKIQSYWNDQFLQSLGVAA